MGQREVNIIQMDTKDIIQEVKRRIGVDSGHAAFYFCVTYGMPFEVYKHETEHYTYADLARLCMRLRKRHPDSFPIWEKIN